MCGVLNKIRIYSEYEYVFVYDKNEYVGACVFVKKQTRLYQFHWKVGF